MGEVVDIRDYYERRADRLLEKIQRSDSPEHKIRLAVEYSKVQSKIRRVSQLNAKRMYGS